MSLNLATPARPYVIEVEKVNRVNSWLVWVYQYKMNGSNDCTLMGTHSLESLARFDAEKLEIILARANAQK